MSDHTETVRFTDDVVRFVGGPLDGETHPYRNATVIVLAPPDEQPRLDLDDFSITVGQAMGLEPAVPLKKIHYRVGWEREEREGCVVYSLVGRILDDDA